MSLPQDPNPGSPFALQLPAFASIRLRSFSAAGEALSQSTGFVVEATNGAPYLIANHSFLASGSVGSAQREGFSASAPAALIAEFNRGGSSNEWIPRVLPLGDRDGKPLWRESSREGGKVDVAALPLDFDLAAEHIELAAYDHQFTAAQLDLASELYVIGYPTTYDPQRAFGMYGIWMRGTLAWPPELDWYDLPCMLVDARTDNGSVGSPVIFWAPSGHPYIDRRGNSEVGPIWSLEGVYGGQIQANPELGIVWKKSVIAELLDNGTIPAKKEVPTLLAAGQEAVAEEATRSLRPSQHAAQPADRSGV